MADCGKVGKLKWFKNHKCQPFCSPDWMKPGVEEYDAFELKRITMSQRTTFEWETPAEKMLDKRLGRFVPEENMMSSLSMEEEGDDSDDEGTKMGWDWKV